MNRGHERGTRHALRSMATAIVSALLLGGCATDVTSSSGRHFETPDEAVETLLVTLRADDPAGLAAYATHPVHLALLDWIRPRLQRTVKVDYSA